MQMRQAKWWLLLVLAVFLSGCPDNGKFFDPCADPEFSCDDNDACTVDTCTPGVGCVNESISCDDGDICTLDRCDENSGCVTAPVSCDDQNQCTSDSCDAVLGCVSTDISASCDDADVCTEDSCDPNAGCVNTASECDDDNECTAESCDPVAGCGSVPVADGTSCNNGVGQCLAASCEPLECFEDARCNDGNECTMDRCDLSVNECFNTDISGSCDDDNACTEDSCDESTGCINTDISGSCDDGNECSVDTCDAEVGCRSEPVEDGAVCAGGTCRGGVCVSLREVEYMQDFESLDQMSVSALGDDGWIVFGNVFDGTTMDFLFGYGTFVAPNDGAAFSAIVLNQGGAEQGDQQLSIYSDYNSTEHANGNLVEANVFRERAMVAADVGRTLSFSFDAKRGNINNPADPLCPCSTTALAFIKTIDPEASFATTNLVTLDTTALSETWDRYEISLPIDAGLVGQLLQVGFSTTATRFQPSANFYDNIEVGSVPTLP